MKNHRILLLVFIILVGLALVSCEDAALSSSDPNVSGVQAHATLEYVHAVQTSTAQAQYAAQWHATVQAAATQDTLKAAYVAAQSTSESNRAAAAATQTEQVWSATATAASSQATAYVSLGNWSQNDPLVPFTTNTALPQIPLDRATADTSARVTATAISPDSTRPANPRKSWCSFVCGRQTHWTGNRNASRRSVCAAGADSRISRSVGPAYQPSRPPRSTTSGAPACSRGSGTP